MVMGYSGIFFQLIGAELMSKRYTQTEKEYMAEMAIEIVVKLNGDYPSFKNYVWAAQHILNGGTPNNQVDELVMEKLKSSGRL